MHSEAYPTRPRPAGSRTFVAGGEEGCPVAAGWDAYWARVAVPLAGQDLAGAVQTLAGWNDLASPQGDLGDCPHCAEQAARLARLVAQATRGER